MHSILLDSYILGTIPTDALLDYDGFMPIPADNGKVTLTADIGDDAPIYNVKVIIRNANPGDNVVINVKNKTNDIVSSSEVSIRTCSFILFCYVICMTLINRTL